MAAAVGIRAVYILGGLLLLIAAAIGFTAPVRSPSVETDTPATGRDAGHLV